MQKDAKIYIAGHTGLVGSAITRKLKQEGYKNLLVRERTELELLSQAAVFEFFESQKPEFVVLAAARVGGIVANNTYRAQFIYENLQIQNNIIEAAYRNGAKKLLFLGSSCIYPKNSPQPMQEHHLLTNVLEYTNEPYAIAKIAGIKMCESYNLQYGTNFVSVMPTNLYGLYDNFDLEKSHVLPALLRKMHLGKCLMKQDFEALRRDLDKNPVGNTTGHASEAEILSTLAKFGIEYDRGNCNLKLWGSGTPRREFLHADDLAAACVFILQNVDFKDIIRNDFGTNPDFDRQNGHEIRNTHINIGVGRDISIKELAALIKNITQFKGSISWDTQKPDGTLQKLLDVRKIEALGWKAKTELEQGITGVYQHYLQQQV